MSNNTAHLQSSKERYPRSANAVPETPEFPGGGPRPLEPAGVPRSGFCGPVATSDLSANPLHPNWPQHPAVTCFDPPPLGISDRMGDAGRRFPSIAGRVPTRLPMRVRKNPNPGAFFIRSGVSWDARGKTAMRRAISVFLVCTLLHWESVAFT